MRKAKKGDLATQHRSSQLKLRILILDRLSTCQNIDKNGEVLCRGLFHRIQVKQRENANIQSSQE
jgi:hypothetical protein